MGGDWFDTRRGHRGRIDAALRTLGDKLLKEEQARGILPDEEELLRKLA